MIHAILITGGDDQSRLEKALQIAEELLGKKTTHHPDFILINAQDSIKINQVRGLQKKLQFKPYAAAIKVVLIQDAFLLTLPAQHSLLKTLEEPPASSIILMTTQNKESLLPTILSRCQIIALPAKPATAGNQTALVNQILRASPGQRLLIAEKYAQSREAATEFCQAQLITWRSFLRNKATPQTPQILRQILKALSLLKSNINPRLVLENLLLSYPS